MDFPKQSEVIGYYDSQIVIEDSFRKVKWTFPVEGILPILIWTQKYAGLGPKSTEPEKMIHWNRHANTDCFFFWSVHMVLRHISAPAKKSVILQLIYEDLFVSLNMIFIGNSSNIRSFLKGWYSILFQLNSLYDIYKVIIIVPIC